MDTKEKQYAAGALAVLDEIAQAYAELLAACQALVDTVDRGDRIVAEVDVIRTIITRARGKST